MREKFIFQIRPISMEEGYQLTCAGIIDHPIRAGRLIETVVLATTLGENLEFEIQIFDVDGERSDVIELTREPLLVD